MRKNFFDGTGTLEGLKCHEVAFYFLMKPRGTQALQSNSYTQGVREYMHWLPIHKLKDYVAYPTFFADELLNIDHVVKHIVTHE